MDTKRIRMLESRRNILMRFLIFFFLRNQGEMHEMAGSVYVLCYLK